jgi:DNA polymerase
MPHEIYVACEGLKRMWRDGHPATVFFWTEMEAAARAAIMCPGDTVRVGEFIEFDMKGVWLRMRLPSGRYLLYPNATAEGERGEISYMAWDTYRKGWCRQGTYGGKLASDARQGLAREFLAYGMVDAEEAGYPLVLTVHDSLLAEVPDSPEFTAAALSGMLTKQRGWAPGIPLAAAGHEMYRYRKL